MDADGCIRWKSRDESHSMMKLCLHKTKYENLFDQVSQKQDWRSMSLRVSVSGNSRHGCRAAMIKKYGDAQGQRSSIDSFKRTTSAQAGNTRPVLIRLNSPTGPSQELAMAGRWDTKEHLL